MPFPPGFLDDHTETVEGLPHPRWAEVYQWIKGHLQPEQAHEAWSQVVGVWLNGLAAALGPEYRVSSSRVFKLLSGRRVKEPSSQLDLIDTGFRRIVELLPAEPEPPVHGPRVVLLFDDRDAYYSYLSPYYRGERIVASRGIFLGHIYRHIAINGDGAEMQKAILHELVHLRISDFKCPVWVNEGLAQYCPQLLQNETTFHLDAVTALRHRAYWAVHSLDSFWSGAAFATGGEGMVLSYHLAERMVRDLLAEFPWAFGAFVRRASYKDAGAKAARECLGVSLGQIAERFLGAGDWEPRGRAR